MADGNTNQRVTNAILQKDIDSLAEKIESLSGNVNTWRVEDRAERDKTSKRLKTVETHTITCSTLWRKHEAEHTRVNTEISDVKGDVKKWSGIGGMVGGIGAILTSIFLDRTP